MRLEKYFYVSNISENQLKKALQFVVNYYHNKTNYAQEVLVFHFHQEQNSYVLYFKNEIDLKQFILYFHFLINTFFRSFKYDVKAYWKVDVGDFAGGKNDHLLLNKRIMFFNPNFETDKRFVHFVSQDDEIYRISAAHHFSLEKTSLKAEKYQEKNQYYLNKFVHLFTITSSTNIPYYGLANSKTTKIISMVIVAISLIIALIAYFLTQA